MPVAKVEATLELEVISCRIEPCGTRVVVVVVEAGARAEAGAETEAVGAVETVRGAATGTTASTN